jgi:hypothetical protein
MFFFFLNSAVFFGSPGFGGKAQTNSSLVNAAEVSARNAAVLSCYFPPLPLNLMTFISET